MALPLLSTDANTAAFLAPCISTILVTHIATSFRFAPRHIGTLRYAALIYSSQRDVFNKSIDASFRSATRLLAARVRSARRDSTQRSLESISLKQRHSPLRSTQLRIAARRTATQRFPIMKGLSK